MIASFKAEWRKLIRRPAVWWLAGMVLLVVALVYGFSWIEYTFPAKGFRSDSGLTVAQLKGALYPIDFARQVVQGISIIGGALMVVLGALVVGSEYGWTTLKSVLTQGPGRSKVLAGQVGAVSVIIGMVVVALYAIAAAASWLIVTTDGHAAIWPAAIDIIKAVATTWLIFEVWMLFGMAMAYVFRQSAMAIGLGLAYMLAIEAILFRALGGLQISWITTAEKFFLGQNGGALTASFGHNFPQPNAPAPLVSPEQAIVVIVLYGLVFLAAAVTLLRVRDVV